MFASTVPVPVIRRLSSSPVEPICSAVHPPTDSLPSMTNEHPRAAGGYIDMQPESYPGIMTSRESASTGCTSSNDDCPASHSIPMAGGQASGPLPLAMSHPSRVTTSTAASNVADRPRDIVLSASVAPIRAAPAPTSMAVDSPAVRARPTTTTKACKPTSNTTDPESSTKSALGRWTREEHEQFLGGLKIYGREWKKVATGIPTRTSAQIRSHAQKYFAKISREEQQRQKASQVAMVKKGRQPAPKGAAKPSALFSAMAAAGLIGRERDLLAAPAVRLSSSAAERMDRILQDPDGVQRKVEQTLAALQERYDQLQHRLREQTRRHRFVSFNGSGGGSTCSELVGPATHALEMLKSNDNATAYARPCNTKKRSVADMVTSMPPATSVLVPSVTVTELAHKPSQQVLDTRNLWSEELIALTVLGGTLPNSDSRERLAAVVDSGAESRNGGVQRTISQTTTDALAKRFKVTK